MKAIATLALLLFMALPAKADEPYVREFVQDIEMSKDDLYNNSLLWLAEAFRSSKEVIELKDKELGIIVGNGRGDVPMVWGVVSPVSYKLKIEVKENKYRLTFSNVTNYSTYSRTEIPIEEMVRKRVDPYVNKHLDGLAAQLHAYLISPQRKEAW